MKMRPLLLAGGVAIAAWLAFFGDKTPTSDITEPVARTSTSGPAKAGTLANTTAPAAPAARTGSSAPNTAKQQREPVVLALLARENLIGGAHASPQVASVFTSQSWTPPPPPPPPTSAKAEPPPPPEAPALPFTYIGKKLEAGNWEVFLARGEKTYIVRDKIVIDGTYRVESIKPPTLSVTYMPLNTLQELSIGGAE